MLVINGVSHPGGAEIGLQRLVERLDGWEVELIAPAVGGLQRRRGARALLSMPGIARRARGHDVVYCNGTVAARTLPAVRGARTVLHVHDLVDRVAPHWRRADVVLADSEAVADRLAPLASHVVGCPVELDVAPAAPPWETDGRPVVGYVGRIEPRKGVLDLVRAAPHIDARVVLVGDDPYDSDPAYRELVRASRAVEHVGWVADAARLMSHLDVLVVPSHAEPFGTVAAEAIAAGTPVVATTVGGLPEVVEDGVTGALVPPGRPDALVEGVARALALGPVPVQAAHRWSADAYARRVESLIAP